MKRVRLLHTGGTLMMRSPPGAPLVPEVYGRDVLAEVPALSRVASLETKILFNLDSADMGPRHWQVLAKEIHEAVASEDVDGVVVVHGTDTMAYSASAVAMMLGPLPKPVVFTGAQKPIFDVRTDARANLMDAVHVATQPLGEVVIVFASRALRAVRATKRDAWAFSAFDSPNCAPVVELGLGVEMASHARERVALAPLDDRLDPRVFVWRMVPGVDARVVQAVLDQGVRGLVIEGFGTGNLPGEQSVIPLIAEAVRREVPVVVVSQCWRGFVDLGRYEGGAAARKAGAISGGDMTVEAALAKLMIALGRCSTRAQVATFFETNLVDEVSS